VSGNLPDNLSNEVREKAEAVAGSHAYPFATG
jgi:hypothetical protein